MTNRHKVVLPAGLFADVDGISSAAQLQIHHIFQRLVFCLEIAGYRLGGKGVSHIRDNYPKYVLRTDEFAGGNYQGIKKMQVADFLLSTEY